jgi:hypothetical protein
MFLLLRLCVITVTILCFYFVAWNKNKEPLQDMQRFFKIEKTMAGLFSLFFGPTVF